MRVSGELSLDSSDHWITLKMMGELFTSPFGMAQCMLGHDAVVIRNRYKSRVHFGFIWLDVRCNMGFYGHLLNPASLVMPA